MQKIRLVAGLGNPEIKYETTRHNIGFRVVDGLAQGRKLVWKNWLYQIDICSIDIDGMVFFGKPRKYMNNSGQAIKEFSDYYKITPQEILVVVDDFSIEFGATRLRKSGSDGGHNGLKSIIEFLGTQDFPRLRLGIGPVPERLCSFKIFKF
jgi:PTH1 family peptidyl-tRNA hydrolase